MLYGWVVIITETSVTRNQNLNPDTDISFTIPVLIFANIANFIVGLIVGILEVIYLEKRFIDYTLKTKFFFKFLIYFALFIILILVFFPIAYTLETGTSLLEPDAWLKLGRFLKSYTFYSTLFQLSVSLLLCLIYSAVSENLGHHVFLNFLTGKYHSPKVEQRIFMFLDMKSSTTIAESLGHLKYFKLLQEYYNLMSDAIINSSGEVYQYIGDEVVISWSMDKGLENANCVNCFFNIDDSIQSNQERLEDKYGFRIDFKAGIHCGEVTIGEVGALKKEIVYTGDVLNTTARIQSLCNELNSRLLITNKLKNLLKVSSIKFESKGEIQLKGKIHSEQLFSAVESIKNNNIV